MAWRVIAVAFLLLLVPLSNVDAGKGRVRIPDDLSDVVDDEEDEDWKAWGKAKAREPPEFDPPPDFEAGMDLQEYQAQLIKRQFGPSMAFIKLRLDVERDANEAPRLARTWTEMLKTGSTNANIVAVDKYTLMLTISDGQDALEVKDFVLRQPEAYEFKLGQSTFRRPGDPPLEVVMERKMKARKTDEEPDSKDEL